VQVIIHGGRDVRVPKDSLNRVDRRAPVEHRCRQAVAEQVRPDAALYPGPPGG
jgi:hypothetical protein